MPVSKPVKSRMRRFGPIVLVVLAIVLFYAFDLDRFVGADAAGQQYATLMQWRHDHAVLSALGFTFFYTSIVAISIPASLWLGVPGGLLFGWFFGGVLSWIASTMGAVLAFLAARSAISPEKSDAAAGRFSSFKAGFERDAFSYIIMLRLLPLPFFVVNLAAGAFHVRTRTFALASAIGLLPPSFLFSIIGAAAADVLKKGGHVDASMLADPKIIAIFSGFSMLALVPIIIRKLRREPLP